jgi:hypothetical protein
MNELLPIIDSVLQSMNIETRYLTEGYFRGVRFIPQMLQRNVRESDFAIVILDGLRPNVAYELGLFHMRGVDIIPLKRSTAKFAVKSAYHKDPLIAFGDIRYRKAAFDHLQDPPLEITEIFSDFQGLEELRFDSIDDTDQNNSLGKKLRVAIEGIIPHLRARTGPDFAQIHLLFPDLDQNLLDESLKILSLFSILGLRLQHETDTTFQPIRDDFISLFINESATIENVMVIIESLIAREENILRNYGRYVTIDSERLINESFRFLLDNQQFNQYYLKIMRSGNSELIRRFIERLSSGEYLKAESIQMLGQYIFTRSNLFTDISILQVKETCELFSTTAYIFPSKAITLLSSWFEPIIPTQIDVLFPFTSNIFNPGNSEESMLWFLSKIAIHDQFFNNSMRILFKFSLPIIIHEEELTHHIHSGSGNLALHRFLEQCYPLQGKVQVTTRWEFIQSMSPDENLPPEYQIAAIDLKFRAIKNFLKRQWTIAGGYHDGSIEIRSFSVQSPNKYSQLEAYRKEAFQLLMNWIQSTEDLYRNDKNFFSYLINNFSRWIRHFNWDQIQEFLVSIFERDVIYRDIFRGHVENLRKYDTWQSSYSQDLLTQIFQFDDELEGSLELVEYFKKYLQVSKYDLDRNLFPEDAEKIAHIQEIHNNLISKMTNSSPEQRDIIKTMLISVNYSESFNFGMYFGEKTDLNDIVTVLNDFQYIIQHQSLEIVSEFFCGLMAALFLLNEDLWETKIEEIWLNEFFAAYREKFLWMGTNLSQFKWRKYNELLNSEQTLPNKILSVISHKAFTEIITIDLIKGTLKLCISQIGRIRLEDLSSGYIGTLNDPISLAYFKLGSIFKKYQQLLDEELANWLLVEWVSHSSFLLSRIHDTSLLIKIGRLSETSLAPWLLQGFSISDLDGDSFLMKSSEFFLPKLFEITMELFSISESEENLTDSNKISIAFEISGECWLLLKFTEAQIEELFLQNSRKLGYMIGRILKHLNPNEPFPRSLSNIITLNHENLDFKHTIFRAFSSGTRSFTGNNYGQAFSADNNRLINWSDQTSDPILLQWFRDLKEYIDNESLRWENTWREGEVR